MAPPLRRLEAGVAKATRGLEGVVGLQGVGLWRSIFSQSRAELPSGRGSFCCTASSCRRSDNRRARDDVNSLFCLFCSVVVNVTVVVTAKECLDSAYG